MKRLLPLVIAGVLVIGSCTDDGGSDTEGTVRSVPLGTGTPDTTGSTPDTTESTESTVSVPPTSGELRLTVVTEVDSLSAMAAHPDTGDLFLAQRDGKVVVVEPSGGAASDPVVDVSGDTEASGEQGLLGLAIAPDGAHLYLHYTNLDGDTRLVEFPLDGTTVDASGRRELLALDQPFPNHNGGQLSFGPDGFLYLGLGDGGAAGDPMGAGQDTSNLLGKILRIDPSAGDPYAIPEDNPFADGGGAPEAWLFGVRNPWRFSWDRDTGDLWIADVGQNQFEEVDHLPAADGGVDAGRGANLGWNGMEGFEPYEDGTAPDGHVLPVFAYSHDEGCSVTGGYVYRGDQLPFLDGVYVFGDYCTSDLWGIRLDADGAAAERLDLGVDVGQNELVSFGEDADGELYVLTNSGTLYRLAPA